MKNRNRFEVLTVVILFTAASLIYGNGLHAQSLKKTFKYIKEGEIVKADIEVHEFKGDQKTSVEDLMLHGLASCLIICNENYQNYDPYKSLELFKTTTEINADKAEVDEFLGKYELTIDKVHDIIFQSIFSQAQKINTEASYQKALSVCEACSYKDEAIKLKEIAAYNEAKNIKSVNGYKYYIDSYAKSEHIAEIKNLLYGIAFQNAKSKMSLLSMNDYLKEYSNNENKFVSVATHLRDSIAFSMVNKSFNEYQEFSNLYPKSEYNELIKKALPDLLYEQASNENKIETFELFIISFPEDKRIPLANKKLESLYYDNLKSRLSVIDYNKFKTKFPMSQFLPLLNDIYTKIIANNDWTRMKLKGEVKNIDNDLFDANGYITEKYSNNKLVESWEYDSKYNLIENKELDSNGEVMRKETYTNDENGKKTKHFESRLYWSKETYSYNNEGKIIEKTFLCNINSKGKYIEEKYSQDIDMKPNITTYSYDLEGKLIEEVEARFESSGWNGVSGTTGFTGYRSSSTKYKYDIKGHLTDRYTFDFNGHNTRTLKRYNQNGVCVEKTEFENGVMKSKTTYNDIEHTEETLEYDENSQNAIMIYNSKCDSLDKTV